MVKAVKTFEDLGICKHLALACNTLLDWKTPTEIQMKTIPHVREGDDDLVVVSPSGSGKTGAFIIPLLDSLLHQPRAYLACVVAPTSILAIQIQAEFNRFQSLLGVTCVALDEEIPFEEQKREILEGPPHIVVATLECLSKFLKNTGGLKKTEVYWLSLFKYLILDEFDLLLHDSFKVAMDEILNAIPRERTFLFSSSMIEVEMLKRACSNPLLIKAASETVDTLVQQFRIVPERFKDCYLFHLLNNSSGSKYMVFTNTSEDASMLALMLQNLGIIALPITRQMTLIKTLEVLGQFAGGKCNVLICTDLISQGLDIASVDMVINYDITQDPVDYIRRVGRTARAGRKGTAVTILSTTDDIDSFCGLQTHIKKKLHGYAVKHGEYNNEKSRDAVEKAKQKKVTQTGGMKRKGGGDANNNNKKVKMFEMYY